MYSDEFIRQTVCSVLLVDTKTTNLVLQSANHVKVYNAEKGAFETFQKALTELEVIRETTDFGLDLLEIQNSIRRCGQLLLDESEPKIKAIVDKLLGSVWKRGQVSEKFCMRCNVVDRHSTAKATYACACDADTELVFMTNNYLYRERNGSQGNRKRDYIMTFGKENLEFFKERPKLLECWFPRNCSQWREKVENEEGCSSSNEFMQNYVLSNEMQDVFARDTAREGARLTSRRMEHDHVRSVCGEYVDIFEIGADPQRRLSVLMEKSESISQRRLVMLKKAAVQYASHVNTNLGDGNVERCVRVLLGLLGSPKNQLDESPDAQRMKRSPELHQVTLATKDVYTTSLVSLCRLMLVIPPFDELLKGAMQTLEETPDFQEQARVDVLMRGIHYSLMKLLAMQRGAAGSSSINYLIVCPLFKKKEDEWVPRSVDGSTHILAGLQFFFKASLAYEYANNRKCLEAFKKETPYGMFVSQILNGDVRSLVHVEASGLLSRLFSIPAEKKYQIRVALNDPRILLVGNEGIPISSELYRNVLLTCRSAIIAQFSELSSTLAEGKDIPMKTAFGSSWGHGRVSYVTCKDSGKLIKLQLPKDWTELFQSLGLAFIEKVKTDESFLVLQLVPRLEMIQRLLFAMLLLGLPTNFRPRDVINLRLAGFHIKGNVVQSVDGLGRPSFVYTTQVEKKKYTSGQTQVGVLNEDLFMLVVGYLEFQGMFSLEYAMKVSEALSDDEMEALKARFHSEPFIDLDPASFAEKNSASLKESHKSFSRVSPDTLAKAGLSLVLPIIDVRCSRKVKENMLLKVMVVEALAMCRESQDPELEQYIETLLRRTSKSLAEEEFIDEFAKSSDHSSTTARISYLAKSVSEKIQQNPWEADEENSSSLWDMWNVTFYPGHRTTLFKDVPEGTAPVNAEMSGVQLSANQRELFELVQARKSLFVKAPTGFGKTIVSILGAFSSCSPSSVVVVLCPNRIQCDQLILSLREKQVLSYGLAAFDVGKPSITPLVLVDTMAAVSTVEAKQRKLVSLAQAKRIHSLLYDEIIEMYGNKVLRPQMKLALEVVLKLKMENDFPIVMLSANLVTALKNDVLTSANALEGRNDTNLLDIEFFVVQNQVNQFKRFHVLRVASETLALERILSLLECLFSGQEDEQSGLEEMQEFISKEGLEGTILVLLKSRKGANECYERFKTFSANLQNIMVHYADGENPLKEEFWKNDTSVKSRVLFSTTVLATGSDLPNVKLVVTEGFLFSLYQVYQAFGRMARGIQTVQLQTNLIAVGSSRKFASKAEEIYAISKDARTFSVRAFGQLGIDEYWNATELVCASAYVHRALFPEEPQDACGVCNVCRAEQQEPQLGMSEQEDTQSTVHLPSARTSTRVFSERRDSDGTNVEDIPTLESKRLRMESASPTGPFSPVSQGPDLRWNSQESGMSSSSLSSPNFVSASPKLAANDLQQRFSSPLGSSNSLRLSQGGESQVSSKTSSTWGASQERTSSQYTGESVTRATSINSTTGSTVLSPHMSLSTAPSGSGLFFYVNIETTCFVCKGTGSKDTRMCPVDRCKVTCGLFTRNGLKIPNCGRCLDVVTRETHTKGEEGTCLFVDAKRRQTILGATLKMCNLCLLPMHKGMSQCKVIKNSMNNVVGLSWHIEQLREAVKQALGVETAQEYFHKLAFGIVFDSTQNRNVLPMEVVLRIFHENRDLI